MENVNIHINFSESMEHLNWNQFNLNNGTFSHIRFNMESQTLLKIASRLVFGKLIKLTLIIVVSLSLHVHNFFVSLRIYVKNSSMACGWRRQHVNVVFLYVLDGHY